MEHITVGRKYNEGKQHLSSAKEIAETTPAEFHKSSARPKWK